LRDARALVPHQTSQGRGESARCHWRRPVITGPGATEFREELRQNFENSHTPTPRSSGDTERELGISKAGNAIIRALAIELAWSWVRRQPTSALTRWYRARFAAGGPRQRRVGIVAVARKLLIALWRHLETGV